MSRLAEGNESPYLQFCCEPKNALKNIVVWTSLVVQWLRLCAPSKGDWGSIPGQGTRAYILQLRVRMLH